MDRLTCTLFICGKCVSLQGEVLALEIGSKIQKKAFEEVSFLRMSINNIHKQKYL